MPAEARGKRTPKTRPAKGRAKAAAKKAPDASALTVADLGARYVVHMEAAGKSPTTILSYGLELAAAARELGAETPLEALTAAQVAAYFDCDAVTKTRDGAAKARRTVEKTRRVLRLALVWAAEAGLIAAAPIPEVS